MTQDIGFLPARGRGARGRGGGGGWGGRKEGGTGEGITPLIREITSFNVSQDRVMLLVEKLGFGLSAKMPYLFGKFKYCFSIVFFLTDSRWQIAGECLYSLKP